MNKESESVSESEDEDRVIHEAGIVGRMLKMCGGVGLGDGSV